MTKKRYAIFPRGLIQNDIVNVLRSCGCEMEIEQNENRLGVVTTKLILSVEESKTKEIELVLNGSNISYKWQV